MSKKPHAQFTANDVEIVAKDLVYRGHFQIEQYHLKHRLFAGGVSKLLYRELIKRSSATAVLPYDPLRNEVVLIEQFRLGALQDNNSPWILELVAGLHDKDETPEAVAQRETREETGLALTALTPIYEYWVSPGGTTEKVHLFCGRIDASQASGIHGLPTEGEDIKVHVFTTAQLYHLLDTGQINNAMTIIALQWLRHNELQLQQQWQAEG